MLPFSRTPVYNSRGHPLDRDDDVRLAAVREAGVADTSRPFSAARFVPANNGGGHGRAARPRRSVATAWPPAASSARKPLPQRLLRLVYNPQTAFGLVVLGLLCVAVVYVAARSP